MKHDKTILKWSHRPFQINCKVTLGHKTTVNLQIEFELIHCTLLAYGQFLSESIFREFHDFLVPSQKSDILNLQKSESSTFKSPKVTLESGFKSPKLFVKIRSLGQKSEGLNNPILSKRLIGSQRFRGLRYIISFFKCQYKYFSSDSSSWNHECNMRWYLSHLQQHWPFSNYSPNWLLVPSLLSVFSQIVKN